MTQEDRAEIRQMLSDILSGHTEEMKGRFNVLHANLIQIKEQTTKTNGRVGQLEQDVELLNKSNIEHPLNCPLKGRVGKLEDDELSRKSIAKFVVQSSVIIGGIVGIIISVIQLITKL